MRDSSALHAHPRAPPRPPNDRKSVNRSSKYEPSPGLRTRRPSSTRLEGWTQCPRGRESTLKRCRDSPKGVCTAKRRPRQNDALEHGPFQTRPARHTNEREITVSGTGSWLCEAHAAAHAAVACTQRLSGLRPRPPNAEQPRPRSQRAEELARDDPRSNDTVCAREGRASHGERAGRLGAFAWMQGAPSPTH